MFANTDGSDMARIVADMREAIAETKFPQGYFASLEGQFQAQEEASRLIGLLSAVSLLLIFVVLYTRYRSTVLALVIMGNVPLALIGSVAALWIAGQPFSVASAIGFITLAGIATRNGILKISHYINLALFEGESFGRQLVIRGTLERLTPVLMTALAAGIALLPLLDRRRRTRQGDIAPRRRDHLRRAHLGDLARRLPDADAVPAVRSQAAREVAERRTPARRHRPLSRRPRFAGLRPAFR